MGLNDLDKAVVGFLLLFTGLCAYDPEAPIILRGISGFITGAGILVFPTGVIGLVSTILKGRSNNDGTNEPH